ncbi:MAG: MnmC family methyltransferase [Oligoflexia bacterium]|nr:MnmC family methyltransferase [Oligoflexia bacterium]
MQFKMDSQFVIVTTRTGALSIRNKANGEIMHNPLGPWLEAQELYIRQSGLEERLCNENFSKVPLVIYDVGLGAAANALAAVDTYLKLKMTNENIRPLHIVSFENDLSLMSFALENSYHFPHIERYQDYLQTLVTSGKVHDIQNSLVWDLQLGHFPDLIKNPLPPAEVIFYDLYSPQSNTEVWTQDVFRDLRKNCVHEPNSAVLLTYSRSTTIRLNMLKSGFYVGTADIPSIRMEGTQAATIPHALNKPLAPQWFDNRGLKSPELTM